MLPIIYAPFPYLDEDRSKNRPLLVLAESKNENRNYYIVAYIANPYNNFT